MELKFAPFGRSVLARWPEDQTPGLHIEQPAGDDARMPLVSVRGAAKDAPDVMMTFSNNITGSGLPISPQVDYQLLASIQDDELRLEVSGLGDPEERASASIDIAAASRVQLQVMRLDVQVAPTFRGQIDWEPTIDGHGDFTRLHPSVTLGIFARRFAAVPGNVFTAPGGRTYAWAEIFAGAERILGKPPTEVGLSRVHDAPGMVLHAAFFVDGNRDELWWPALSGIPEHDWFPVDGPHEPIPLHDVAMPLARETVRELRPELPDAGPASPG